MSFELLKELSYQSSLGIRLKKNLHYFNKHDLLDELQYVNEWYDSCNQLQELSIDYRIKSIQSAILKNENEFKEALYYVLSDSEKV